MSKLKLTITAAALAFALQVQAADQAVQPPQPEAGQSQGWQQASESIEVKQTDAGVMIRGTGIRAPQQQPARAAFSPELIEGVERQNAATRAWSR